MRSSNYHTFSSLIKNFKSIEDLNKIEKRIEKFYDLGLISEGEFRALDLMILDTTSKAAEFWKFAWIAATLSLMKFNFSIK